MALCPSCNTASLIIRSVVIANMTNNNSTAVRCKLKGIPRGVDSEEAKAFIKSLLGMGVVVETFDEHVHSCSALLRVPNEGVVQNIHSLLQSQPIAGTDAQMSLTRVQDEEFQKKTKNDKVDALAKGFHQYLHENPELLQQASDRDVTGRLFQAYCRSLPDCDTNTTNTRRLEASVFTRMRQCKLLRSKRFGDSVVMTFANLDGMFPTTKEQKSQREQVLENRKQASMDKFGVKVSEIEEDTEVVSIGETKRFTLTIQSSSEDEAVLEKLNLLGPQCKDYTLKNVRLPASLSKKPVQLELTIAPNRIGIFRAALHCHFVSGEKNFKIVRYISVRGVADKAISQVLQPQSPYQPRKRKAFERKPKQSYEPPKNNNIAESNPFRNLPFHSIPINVKELITNSEFGNVVPETMTLDNYGSFWKHVLWANEFQAFQDIQLFDMENVQLKRVGNSYSLNVPGLAEGRPSVLRGDLVFVTFQKRLYKGRVKQTKLLEVELEFHSSFAKRYNPSVDVVNVRFTFSRMTYRTSHQGVLQAEATMGETMLLPDANNLQSKHNKNQRKSPRKWKWANRDLNKEQTEAVRSIVVGKLRPLPYIIYGPPGTGKTTTVVEAVYQLANHDDAPIILLVAPSNDAADILVQRLAPHFPPSELRRLLAYSRSLESVPAAIRDYCSEGLTNPAQLGEFLSMRIVVCTVNLAARLSYYGVPTGHYDVLVVDEAGHATEPEVVAVAASSLLNFQKGGQLVLAGDPKQLGPIVTSDVCRHFGMQVSYMERLMKRNVYERQEDGKYPPDLVTKLVRNYRSHPSILKLPNSMFYDGELESCGDYMATHNMANWEHLPKKGFPVLFHAVSGENLREGNSPSWFNPEEAQQVVSYVDLLLRQTRPALKEEEIGIITPYARQAQKIRLALEKKNVHNVKVGSVECFQGQERRCIILSTVRAEAELVSSDLKYNLGFVANEKRFNVAVTRAKTLLVVVGCPTVLALDKERWLPFLVYCRDNGSWLGEEWDPSNEAVAQLQDGREQDQEWDLVGPSHAAGQEAFAFINREE